MSNNQMVSVPRDELEAACQRFAKAQIFDFSRRMRALLAPPAEQHQGEPVAKMTLEQLLADLPDGYSKDDVAYGWHECADNYPHADPAEVERLRDQLAAWQALAAERLEVTTGLRTQLAEAHSLLHEVGASGCMVDGQIMPSNEALELQDRVDSALCASAEPSPVIAWSVIETPPSESPAIQTTISLQR